MFKLGDLVEADKDKFENSTMGIDLYNNIWKGLIGIIIEVGNKTRVKWFDAHFPIQTWDVSYLKKYWRNNEN